ncbi:flagellar biosynthetic protein FliO [Escherichia sp. E10V10]|uniref:flagellar biosynthetic protein FliO n=1 Tax=unclassified Escherichia TaxID=2608889 RepID=UPI00102A8A70|nr:MULTISPECIES: flagellar biosynthetic protein FliO [unclassified Escherichia]TGB62296.1 flagellar biosynthetic protein FliO [Escherichia coli]RZM85167.1 flagellar biosynthetic protein FliO [Escherichia sp. E1V33]RZM92103.1 flagellar biosynthetic protein FliO [Escherichia sp. E14V5]RZN00805.1 flagellar biosynthetic protein FliO [Escherichia sp. E14V7]RZN18255.1 flagellar biosynthetic protein FliO [Escherichia sp. E14S1]
MINSTHTVLPTASTTSMSSVWMHTGGILCLIIFGLLLLLWYLRRSGGISGKKNGRNALLNIKFSQSLGPRERLVLVEVGNQWLLLGVTAEKISCLSAIDKKTVEENFAAVDQPQSRSSLVDCFQTVLANSLRGRYGKSQ